MDWAKVFQEHMREELTDSLKYAAMAKAAENPDRQVLRCIAWEEYHHAKHTKRMAQEHGTVISDADKAMFDKVFQELVAV